MLTLATVVLAPLCFLLILLPWRFTLVGLLPMATFADTAVLNVGSFGLQPAYLLALLVLGRTLAELTLLRALMNGRILRDLAPLLLFAGLSFLSLWIGLAFFQGRVMVLFGAAGFDLDLAQPYGLNRQSFTQLFYIGLNTGLAFAVAHQLVRLEPRVAAATVDRAIVLSLVIAATVMIWEQISYYYGFHFPYEFFHSNIGAIPAFGQTFGTILRPSGSFSESSGIAYFFAGAIFFALVRYRHRPNLASLALLIISFLSLVSSTSSTAYVVLAVFAASAVTMMLVALLRGTAGRPVPIGSGHAAAAAAVVLVAAGVAVYAQSHAEEIREVARQTIFEKDSTSSFEQRTGADLMALDIVLRTGGLGLGLGAHKANNLFMTLLASAGVLGTSAFAVFVLGVLRSPPGPVERARAVDRAGREARALVIGFLLVHAVSAPSLNSIFLFCGFGFCLGLRALLSPDGDPVARVGTVPPAPGGPAAERVRLGSIPV